MNEMVAANLKTTKYRWVVLLVYMYIAALTQLFWLNFAGIDTYMETALRFSAMKVGMLAAVFPFTFLILSIPAGVVSDRKGYKFAVGIGAILTGVFAAVRLFSPYSYLMLFVSQFGISLGQPFVLNAITKLSVTWFPENEDATAVGFGSLALFLGMIVGLGLTPVLVKNFGFVKMLWFYSTLAVLGIPLFYIFTKDKPDFPPRVEETEFEVSYLQGIKNLSKIRDFILLGFVALIGIGVFNGIVTWLEKILNELHGISMLKAGNISSILVFSGMLGCIVIPVLSDKLRKRKPFLIVASAVGIFSVFVLLRGPTYSVQFANAAVFGFFAISILPLLLAMSAEIAGSRFAGISAAYLQLLGNGAAVLIVPLIEVLHRVSGGYALPLYFIVSLFFVALFLALLIREPKK